MMLLNAALEVCMHAHTGRSKDMLLMRGFWQSADMYLCIARVPIVLKVCTSHRESRSHPQAASFVKNMPRRECSCLLSCRPQSEQYQQKLFTRQCGQQTDLYAR